MKRGIMRELISRWFTIIDQNSIQRGHRYRRKPTEVGQLDTRGGKDGRRGAAEDRARRRGESDEPSVDEGDVQSVSQEGSICRREGARCR